MSGTLEFSLAIADIDINDVWSAADPSEEVVLELSTDGGITYNQLAKYDVDSFASWTDLSVSLPDPIIGSKYRWRQLSYSFGDHWAIDNIVFRDSNGNIIASDNFESGTASSLLSSINNGVVNTNGNNAPGNGTKSLWFGPSSGTRLVIANPVGVLDIDAIVINSDIDPLLDENPDNDPTVYFAFEAANSDGFSHVKFLGNNKFVFEDLPNGGDLDYNDIILQYDFLDRNSNDPLDELFDYPLFRFHNTDNGGYLFAGVEESESVRQNLNGNVEFGSERIITTDARHAESVYAVDVDGDEDNDVLSASWRDNKVAWYENDGNANFIEHVISTNAQEAHGVFAIDLDEDEDIDVLSASHYGNTIAWYENDGNANFTEYVISTNAEGAKSVFAIDLDGDEDIDVLSASRFDNKIAWYENDGNTNFTEKVISTNSSFANRVFAIDLDGDNDIDVLSASVHDNKIAWYENDGNTNFTEHVISTNAHGVEDVFAIDLDGDNDIDVLSASSGQNKIAWYENDSNANFTERVLSINADSAVSVFAIDLDGDSDKDVLSASTLDYKVAWYENLPNYSNFIEEGKAFNVSSKPGDELIRFNRFRHSNTGGYLFAGEEESEIVRRDYPSFVEEGIAFYAYGTEAGLGVDIYRFQNSEVPGSYIFVGEAEKNSIEANYPQFVLEGVAFEAEF